MMDLEYDRGWRLDLDANPIGLSAVQFRVWAPRAKAVSVHVCDPRRNPVPMEPREFGYFEVTIESVRPGDRYHYLVDGEKVRPDPLPDPNRMASIRLLPWSIPMCSAGRIRHGVDSRSKT